MTEVVAVVNAASTIVPVVALELSKGRTVLAITAAAGTFSMSVVGSLSS